MKERRLTTRIFLLLLSAALCVTMMPLAGYGAEKTDSSHIFKLAVLSDVYYVMPEAVPDTGTTARANFDYAEQSELRMMSEMDKILDQALSDVKTEQPDAVVVCGDLTSNGEYANNKGFADKLRAAKADMPDAGIYVINGNHDINNSYAADFNEDANKVSNAKRVLASDFKQLYDQLGYGGGSEIRYYEAVPEDLAKNYGTLSYAAEIEEGITLIALDTAIYSNDPYARFEAGQKTAGAISDGLLAWAVKEAKDARAKGNLVLAMCHHGVIPHFSEAQNNEDQQNVIMDTFMEQYVVPDWENVAGTLADAGVTAVLTGHGHTSDIAKYTSVNGNTIYDIETAALCAYPCAWRTIEITIRENGNEKTCDFDVKTNFINTVDNLIGDNKTIHYHDADYSDLQTYSFVKTGLQESAIVPLAGYFFRENLWEIRNSRNGEYKGMSAYLRNKFPDSFGYGESIGESVPRLIKEYLAKNNLNMTQEFELFGTKYWLTIRHDEEAVNKEEQGEKDSIVLHLSLRYNGSESTDPSDTVTINAGKLSAEVKAETEEMIEELRASRLLNCKKSGVGVSETWTLRLLQQNTEEGFLTIDLTGFPQAIDEIITKTDEDLSNDADWTTNYAVCPLQQDLNKLVGNVMIPVMNYELDTEDHFTAVQIMNDAYQCHARGDEGTYVYKQYQDKGWTSAKLKAKRDEWHTLLQDENKEYATVMRDTAFNEVMKICDSEQDKPVYPELKELADVNFTSDGGDSIFSFQKKGDSATYLELITAFLLSDIHSVGTALDTLNNLNNLGVKPLSPDTFRTFTDLLASTQYDMVTDTSGIPDAEYQFRARMHGGADKSDEDQKAAARVSEMIAAIPADPSRAASDAVSDAVEAYNALTDDQRKLLAADDIKKLQAALNYPASVRRIKLKSLKAGKGRKATARWTKGSHANGYQLYYKAKGVKAKKVNINSAGTLKKKVRKLRAGRKYTFRVRAFTKVQNLTSPGTSIKVYGKWSNARKVKIRR